MKAQKIYLLLLLNAPTFFCLGQKQTVITSYLPKNSFFIEYTNNNRLHLFSANIERIVFQKNYHAILTRLGFASGFARIEYFNSNGRKEIIPLLGSIFSLSYLASDRTHSHHFEIGGGFGIYQITIKEGNLFLRGNTIVIDSTKRANYFTQAIFYRLGYRFQRPEKKMYFKIGFIPLMHNNTWSKIRVSFRYWQTYLVPYFDMGLGWAL